MTKAAKVDWEAEFAQAVEDLAEEQPPYTGLSVADLVKRYSEEDDYLETTDELGDWEIDCFCEAVLRRTRNEINSRPILTKADAIAIVDLIELEKEWPERLSEICNSLRVYLKRLDYQ